MEVSALKYSAGIGLHGRSPLLRLQSDERLIAFLRKGNAAAFDVLVARYETRLLTFCRHLLGSREDAEDVLQEVMTAAFNAILADERPINVRPWLYRIARNRSLNHMRRIQAIGVDSMDHHLSENGASTADKVHEREEFRLLVGDIHELPETQKTALVLREMDALSYDQIAEAMETTVPSVKSLLVRARVSLAEAAEARLLSCEEVRIELGEVAEGLRRRPGPLVRRHLRGCERCATFRLQLRETNKALAALLPVGPLVVLRKLLFLHLGHSAGAGSGATAAGSTASAAGAGAASAGAASAGAAGTTALAGSTVVAGSGGFISAGIGAIAGKAAAGLAAAALVTAGAVEVDHSAVHHSTYRTAVAALPVVSSPVQEASVAPVSSYPERRSSVRSDAVAKRHVAPAAKTAPAAGAAKAPAKPVTTTVASSAKPSNPEVTLTGRTQTQSDPTVLPPAATAPALPTTAAPVSPAPAAAEPTTTQTTPTPTVTQPTTTTPTPTTTTPTTTTPTTTTPTTTTPTTTTPTTTTPTTTTPTTTTPTTTTPTTTTPSTTGTRVTSPPPLPPIRDPQLDLRAYSPT
jgi:RNA polymerase sigma factor (sigma-70 family)